MFFLLFHTDPITIDTHIPQTCTAVLFVFEAVASRRQLFLIAVLFS